MKKILGLLMICTVLVYPVIGNADAYHIYLDNDKFNLETSHFVFEDTVYVPLREASDIFGAEVRWHPEAQGIALLEDNTIWILMQDGSGLYKNGRLAAENAPVIVKDGISMVPIRLVAYIFNYDLVWESQTNSIYLQKIEPEITKPTDENTDISIEDTSIMGKSVATAEQMAKFLLRNNSNPKIPCTALELSQIYLEEGKKEGVRGDLAFAQSIQETGYFKFGGNVKPEQYNFAGMGSTSSGVKGNYFETAREGIRAQIQHLKAYASTEPLNQECVDGRFSLVTRGSATRLEDLANAVNPNNSGWAYPGYDRNRYRSVAEAYEAEQTYGQKIKIILEKILNTK